MKGFTLIELLVVVLIIGILASVALPQYEAVVEKSRATEALVNAKAILDAMQRHDQEFPGETVTNCMQIADVQLKGGQWTRNTCNTPGSATCSANNQNIFSTRNFCYTINNGSLTVQRYDRNNVTPIYTITYANFESPAVAGNGCEGDYTQVCRLFTDL